MIDVVSSIRKLNRDGQTLAIATVINTWKSSPRPVGAALIISENGDMTGSVSGGCVEGAVAKKALEIMKNNQAEVLHFGITDDDAWEVGLSCGGALDVFVQPFYPVAIWHLMDELLTKDEGFTLLSTLEANPQYSIIKANGESIGAAFEKSLLPELEQAFYEGDSKVLSSGNHFAQVFPKKPVMLLIGSAHITVELTELAHMFGFETLLIDPRATFADKTQYKVKPQTIHVEWPQEVLPNLKLDKNTFAVILSHDPKIDDEALKLLLKSEVAYIGALGSRKTHAKRIHRLKDYGFDSEEMDRIHAPIGIDIGSKLPREIALSIMAEVIKVKNRG
ncbi:XdhC family protein [Roseivirga echinicomitans]